MSDHVTSAQAAELADITPSGFRKLVTNAQNGKVKDPPPTAVISGGRGQTSYWDRDAIIEWAATRDRTTGRRAYK